MVPIVETKITIGGQAGTGKGTISKLLAELLGYELNSAGNYFHWIATRERVTDRELEERALLYQRYDLEIDERTASYGRTSDNFVLDGRVAWYMIPDSVKVLLICEYDERIRRVSVRDKMSFKDALDATEHREESARMRYFNLYGIKDITETQHYDIVIDTTKTLPEDSVAIIVGYLSYMSERR